MEKPFAIFAQCDFGTYIETYNSLKSLSQAVRRKPNRYPKRVILAYNGSSYEPILFTTSCYITASTCSMRLQELQLNYDSLKKDYYNTYQHIKRNLL